ncbi:hypothetical protein [Methylobacterium mesophilicum]
MTMTSHAPQGAPSHRDPSLGAEYLPDLHREPTIDDARMWCQGAKVGLRFAADLVRTAHAHGVGVEAMLASIEGSTAVPHRDERKGRECETAVILRRDVSPDRDDSGAWFAWTIPSRGERDTAGYLRAVGLCRGGHPSDEEIHAALAGAAPFGSQGNVYRVAAERRRTRVTSPVTVRFEGGYPRYTSTPKEGQSLREFVFDCAVKLGSERLTALMGNDQALFEVEGGRVRESDQASGYGGKTVTVVMVYDPMEPIRLSPGQIEDPCPAASPGAWLSGEDMIGAFYAK